MQHYRQHKERILPSSLPVSPWPPCTPSVCMRSPPTTTLPAPPAPAEGGHRPPIPPPAAACQAALPLRSFPRRWGGEGTAQRRPVGQAGGLAAVAVGVCVHRPVAERRISPEFTPFSCGACASACTSPTAAAGSISSPAYGGPQLCTPSPYADAWAHLEQHDKQGQGSLYQRGLEHRSRTVSQLAEEQGDQAGGPKHLDCLV